MSDHNENKHAAEAEGCQPNGVQSDIELRKWAIQTILLSPHPLPSSKEVLEKASLRLVSFARSGTLFPELSPLVNTSTFGRTVKAGDKNIGGFQRIKNFALIILKFPYALLKLLRRWFHKESSFVGCRKQRMDDGGRRGNAPPNAANAKIPEKQSGVVG